MAYFVHNLDSTRLMLHFYIFTWGLLRGTEPFLKMTFFVLNLDSKWLILHLHFYILLFYMGIWSRVLNLTSRLVILFNFWTRDGNFTSVLFLMGSAQPAEGSRIWSQVGLFYPRSGFGIANFHFLQLYIFTWGFALWFWIWPQDSLFCPKSGLEMANFTYLHFT